MNRSKVYQVVEENGVVTLKADWTDGSEEVSELLEELGSNSIPLYAVFPAGSPDEPLVLRDLVSQQSILELLREAGPSPGSQAMAPVATQGQLPEDELPWQPYSLNRLTQLIDEGRTVLIDFTAHW